MPERRRRSVWRTALKALGAAAGVVALLIGGGFICASPQVRNSAFGLRMEHRFPIRWSQVTLVFGNERERAGAVSTLHMTGDVRALGPLRRAANDRSRVVSGVALGSIEEIGWVHPEEAQACLLDLSRSAQPRLRAGAYHLLYIALNNNSGVPAAPELQEALTCGLHDANAECRAEAFGLAVALEELEIGLRPETIRAVEYCLRSRPPAPTVSVAQDQQLHRSASSFPEFRRALAREKGSDVGMIEALYWLWSLDAPKARRTIEDELRKHPLVAPRAAGRAERGTLRLRSGRPG